MSQQRIKKALHTFYNDNFTPPLSCSNDNKQSKQRIAFIDLAKGVCILLVFYGHSNMVEYFDIPLVQSLRMPLYFFLSGLFFKYYDSFVNLIVKKFNKLIVPFVFFSLLATPLIFVQHHSLPLDRLLAPIVDPRGGYNIVMWFLLCLFWCNVIFGIIYFITKNTLFQSIAVIVVGVAGCMLATFKIVLPLHTTQAMMAIPFFFAGFVTKGTSLLYRNPRFDRWLVPVGLTLIAVSWIVFYLFEEPAVYFLDLVLKGNVLLAYLISLTIVIGTLLLCKSIGWLPVVSYFGRYSIIVLGIHWLAIKAYSILHCVLISPQFSIPLRFVVCLVCCWLAIPVFRKFFPSFTSQKDLIAWPKR